MNFFKGLGQIVNGLFLVLSLGFYNPKLDQWIFDRAFLTRLSFQRMMLRREHKRSTFRIHPKGGLYRTRGPVYSYDEIVEVVPNEDGWYDGLPFKIMKNGHPNYTCDERGWVWPDPKTICKSPLDIVSAA